MHAISGLHEERQADADPHRERPVAGGEHQRGDEGLVGELDQEDRAERDGDDGEIHPSNLPGGVRATFTPDLLPVSVGRVLAEDRGRLTHPRGSSNDGEVRALRPRHTELDRADDARPGRARRPSTATLFGWSFDDHDMGEMGHYYIGNVEGDDVAGISGQMPGMEGHPAFWGVYLAVDDVDAATAKVEAAGGKVEAGPFDVNDQRPDVRDPGPDRGARRPVAGQRARSAPQRANEPGTPIWNECVTPDIADGACSSTPRCSAWAREDDATWARSAPTPCSPTPRAGRSAAR